MELVDVPKPCVEKDTDVLLKVKVVGVCGSDVHYYETGRMVGIKPAGGISKAKLAVHYLVMLRETLGTAWMTNEWFRFGASSLANDVLMQLQKQATGVYQSADYFSKD